MGYGGCQPVSPKRGPAGVAGSWGLVDLTPLPAQMWGPGCGSRSNERAVVSYQLRMFLTSSEARWVRLRNSLIQTEAPFIPVRCVDLSAWLSKNSNRLACMFLVIPSE